MLLLAIGHLPEFPSSRPITSGNSGLEIREYIKENIFAVICFIVSVTLALLIEIYGLFLRCKISKLEVKSNAIVMRGLLILVSGVWILTDSKTLTVFTTNYGGTLDKNAITFVSYICFMLISVIFSSFLQSIIPIKRLEKINDLFILY